MSKNFKRYIFIIFTFLVSSKMLVAQIDFWERTGQEVNAKVWSLAVANNGNVWAGTDNGIYLSTNDGDSWVARNNGLLAGTSIHRVRAIAISPTNGYIFAGTYEEGLFRSTDNGGSWTNINIVDSLMIRSIVITSLGEIYLGTILRFVNDRDAGVYYSSNNGNTWVQRNNGLGTLYIQALALGSDGTLYAGTPANGIFRSTDGGNNWSLSSYSNNADIQALTISGDGSIFATTFRTPGGVIKSTDRGNTWSRVINGLSDLQGTAILYNPITRHIFNATFSQGAFRTTNLGDSWYKINNGLPPLTVDGISVNTVRGFAVNSTSGRMYIGTVGSGVYRSRIFNTPILYTDIDTIEFTATYGGSLPASKKFLVTNVSDVGNLSWSATKNLTWFDITPTSVNNINNQEVTISINSTTAFPPGENYGRITITAPNAGENSSPKDVVVKYTITGARIDVVPVIDFGSILLANPPEDRTFTIRNTGNAPLTINSLADFQIGGANSGDFQFVTTGLRFPINIAAGENRDFTVRFLHLSLGEKRATLTINHNAFDQSSTVITLVGNVVKPIIDIDPTLNFGDVTFGDTKDTVVNIRNIGDGRLTLLSSQNGVRVAGTDRAMFALTLPTLPYNIEPNNDYDLRISFTPTSVVGAKSAILIIPHTAEGSPDTVRLLANVLEAGKPSISIDPSTVLDFEDVIVGGDPKPLSIVIKNNGDANLKISQIGINNITEDDAFILPYPEGEITISPDNSTGHYIFVHFSPTVARDYTGTLTLTHNADNLPSPISIRLTGRGVSSSIEVDPKRIDFGNVNVGNSDERNVRITNNGTSQLVISDVSIDVGGQGGFSLNDDRPITIEADSYHDITVTFSPLLANQSYIGVITLTHNADGSPTPIPLTGRGVQAGIEINPNPLIFGDVPINSPSIRNITIQNSGSADLVITQANINGAGFTLSGVTIPPSITIPEDSSRTIAVQFLPTEARDYTGTITLTHNADGSPSTIQLTGSGVQASITITPNPLNFGDVPINSPKTENIIIQNGGDADLQITQATINGTGFTLSGVTIPITITAGGSHTIAVQFLPTEARDYDGSIILTHNAGGGSSNVQITGRGTSSGITLSPTSISFGDINVGVSSQQSVQITNNGNSPLIISQVSKTGANEFTLPNNENTITVSAGESRELFVQFSPTAIGDYTGTIILTHNASGGSSTIPLSGRGIISNVRVAIKRYTVKPNETIPISVDVIDDLTDRNVKEFSFILKYNKRILSYKGVNSILSNTLTPDTTGSVYGELVVKVTNSTGTALVGTGTSKLIEFNFLGLIGDSCGTHLILESFKFNSDGGGPTAIIENGYCELFGRCGGEQAYVTSERDEILYQNNPNPIREGYESTIQYRITTAGQTNLTVYDILGREVARLVNEYKSEGLYSVTFNTKGLPSGVYFYRLRVPGYDGLKKMVIVK